MAAVLLAGVVVMVVGVLAVGALVAVAASLVGAVLWLVLLPFRLVMLAFKLAVFAVAGGLGLAILAVTGVVVAVGLLLALVAPLLPLALVVGAIWYLARSSRRPARA